MESNTTEETVNVKPSPSRRGKTLGVAKIVVVLEDGTVEQWEFPPGWPAYYREGGNRQTKPAASWKSHTLWWTSDHRGAS